MSTEIMTQEQNLSLKTGIELPKIKQLVPLLTATQWGWLALENKKSTAFRTIEKFELSIQGKVGTIIQIDEKGEVTGVEKDLAKVQTSLRSIVSELAEMKDCRLQFTKEIETKIVEPAMQFEKRSAILVDKVAGYELSLRLDMNRKADSEAALNREITNFTTHITNEYFRIATLYRNSLKSEISKVYVGALENQMPIKGVPDLIKSLKETLIKIEKPGFIKFNRVLLDDNKARELFLSVPAYNHKPDLDKSLAEVDEIFSMYANDFENAEKASQAHLEEANREIEENNERLEIEQATNILTSQAAPILHMTGGAKIKVKKKLDVVIEENEKWEITILNIFIKNWQTVRPLIKSSSAKLNIGQMAAAIGKMVTEKPDLKETLKGIKFIEKVK